VVAYFMFIFFLTEKVIFRYAWEGESSAQLKADHVFTDNLVQVQGTFLML